MIRHEDLNTFEVICLSTFNFNFDSSKKKGNFIKWICIQETESDINKLKIEINKRRMKNA